MKFIPNEKNIAKLLEASKKGLIKASETLKTDSNRLAPQDQTDLINSSDISYVNELTAEISYNTPYAKRLHEHPEYKFSKDRNPQAQGKYLEKPTMDGDKYIKIINDEIRKVVR